MTEVIAISKAMKTLPELADHVNTGQTYVISRHGQGLAVLMGIEEYERLKAIEEQYQKKDFDTLLSPPSQDVMAEDAARELAVKIVCELRS